MNFRDPFGLCDEGQWVNVGDYDIWMPGDPNRFTERYLNSRIISRTRPQPPPWNPTGHAQVVGGRKIGGYGILGGEIGEITLRFDNNLTQNYGYLGGGVGLGPSVSVALGGHVYGVYETEDFTGPFVDVEGGFLGGGSMSYWGFGEDAVAGWNAGVTAPGASASLQGYWRRGDPY